MKKVSFYIFLFNACYFGCCFAQAITGADIERTQIILQKEEAFKQIINKPEKLHIKDIVLDGVTLLSTDQLNSLILPFKRRWLYENDIKGILDSIKILYQKNGFANQPENISFKLEKCILKIRVVEVLPQEKE